MSAPTEPFAKGYGILLGVLILWAGVAVALLVGNEVIGAIFGPES